MPAPLARPDAASVVAATRLGAPMIAVAVASAATPLTVAVALVPTTVANTGHTAMAAAFLVVGALLALFAPGYVAMARRVPHAGAFYSYIAAGLGRGPALGAAVIAHVAYNALQFGLYGAIGPPLADMVGELSGHTPPWWAAAIGAWLLVAVLGVRRLRHSARLLAVLLVAEVALVIAYTVANLAHPATGLAPEALSPTSLTGGGSALLAIAVLGYIGFEQTAVFSEVSTPRSVRAATYGAIAGLALLYTTSAWSTVIAAGPALTADTDPVAVMFALAETNLGPWAGQAGRILLMTSVLAALIAFHTTCDRYSWALGREGVLPARLGDTDPRTEQPVAASVLQSAMALQVILVCAVLDIDPINGLFYGLGTTGAIGVLLLITATAVAIAVHLWRPPTAPGDIPASTRTRLASLAAAAGLALATGVVITHLPALYGAVPDSPMSYAVPAGYTLLCLAGMAWAARLRRRRPEVHQAIGRGHTTKPR